ncbi:MAG: hypothetical protein ACE5MK_06935 [Acidobacteriota bacterium]
MMMGINKKRVVKSGCICLTFILMGSGCASAQEKSPKTLRQENKVDIHALTEDLQIHSRRGDEVVMVMWHPAEFWRASMAQNPASTEAHTEKAVNHLRRYTITSVVAGTQGPFGAITFQSEEDVRTNIQIRDAEGNYYRPISEDNLDADTKVFLSVMSMPLATMLGSVGQNMHFIVFPSKNIKGQYIADATKEGTFVVQLGEREFTWRLPLSSLVPPKICPVDGEKMSGAWKFCPWHGTKLVSE